MTQGIVYGSPKALHAIDRSGSKVKGHGQVNRSSGRVLVCHVRALQPSLIVRIGASLARQASGRRTMRPSGRCAQANSHGKTAAHSMCARLASCQRADDSRATLKSQHRCAFASVTVACEVGCAVKPRHPKHPVFFARLACQASHPFSRVIY